MENVRGGDTELTFFEYVFYASLALVFTITRKITIKKDEKKICKYRLEKSDKKECQQTKANKYLPSSLLPFDIFSASLLTNNFLLSLQFSKLPFKLDQKSKVKVYIYVYFICFYFSFSFSKS